MQLCNPGAVTIPTSSSRRRLEQPLAAFDPDAAAYFAAAGITDPTQKNAWNTFVLAGKAAGWYSGLSYCWPMIGDTFNQHKINAITPASNVLVKTGTVTSASTGMTPNGTTGWLDTGVDASTLTASNCHFSLYSRALSGSGGNDFGIFDAGTVNFLSGLTTQADDTCNGRIFMVGGEAALAAATTAGGAFTFSRTGTTVKAYRNGTLFDTQMNSADASTFAFSLPLFANSFAGSVFPSGSTRELSFFSIGTNRAAPNEASFATALIALQTSLGRNV